MNKRLIFYYDDIEACLTVVKTKQNDLQELCQFYGSPRKGISRRF